MNQNHRKLIAIFLLIPLTLSSGLAAAQTKTVSSKHPPAEPNAKAPPKISYHEGLLAVEAKDTDLNTVLGLVTAQTQVKFNIAKDELKRTPVTVKIEERPYEEAIRLLLADFNTLHVWNEQLKLLEVNVLGRAEKNADASAKAKENITAKGAPKTAEAKPHPHSHPPVDAARVESALKEIHSDDPNQRQAAMEDLIGGADARIAPAMLEVALSQPTEASQGDPTGTGDESGARGGDDTPFRAALSLWRHGLERGFADNETISALKTLQEQGSPATRNIATQALDDMQAHF